MMDKCSHSKKTIHIDYIYAIIIKKIGDKMEEQYKQVTNIINELAASNPYITREQVAKAKSMYNGDTRSIDIIRRELEAYSNEILAQGLKAEQDKKLARPKDEEKKEPIISVRPVTPVPTPVPPILGDNPKTEEQPQEIYEPIRTKLPDEEKQKQLQSMIDDALGGSADNLEEENTYTQGNQPSKEQGKVLTKTQPQEPTPSQAQSDDGGYGNVTALLSLTIIFSIVTIIIAFFTIIS